MQPVIMHLDMNSFFASCEQQDNAAWRGRPVGVCEHLGGIIIAASVEAKKWGITTGTPVWEAKKLYPKIILTHTHPDRYRLYNRRLVKLVNDYTDRLEVYSIDEVFLDLTKVCNVKKVISDQWIVGSEPFEEAVNIAKEIKRWMTTTVGDWLRCSIGIADNKVLAKIASEMQKPDGLVVVSSLLACHSGQAIARAGIQDVGQVMDSGYPPVGGFRNDNNKGFLEFSKDHLYRRLKLTDIPGIGRRQEKKLNELGIKTLRDLKNCPQSWLVARFGVIGGYHLYNLGQLRSSWKPVVEQEETIKSMGHMYTLPQEFRERKFFAPVLYKLSEMVGRRLRQQDLEGNVLHFYVADSRHGYFGHSRRLGYFVYDGREIFLESLRIFENLSVPGEIFKLIGVTVAGLRPYQHQQSLFGDEEQKRRLAAALDRINQKYGDFTICRVPVLAAGRVFRDSIGFGRIKELRR